MRHIQVSSDADIAYDTATDFQVRMGMGYIRLLTRWADEDSFDRDILIRPVHNPFTVYLDPGAIEPDKSDANFGFIINDLTPARFKRQYKDSTLSSLTQFSSIGDTEKQWVNAKLIRIAEYFEVKESGKNLVRLENGQSMEIKASEGDILYQSLRTGDTEVYTEGSPSDDINPDVGLIRVIETRDAVKRTVHWYKITAREKLDETEWLGSFIPIIPVCGEVINVDGETIVEGIVRNSKDAQRMYNFHSSNEAALIATAPKAKVKIAEGQIEGHTSTWEALNDPDLAVAVYKEKSLEGHLVPPPELMNVEPPIQAVSIARAQSYEDVQRTMGVHSASLGEKSNEKSGIAIRERKAEGDMSTFNYMDNLGRSLKFVGKQLLDLIPKAYTKARVARILGEDMKPERAMVYNSQVASPPEQMPSGIDRIYDIGVGKYDAVVTVGPSYSTRRQENADFMINLTKVLPPEMVARFADLLVKAQDVVMAEEIAERLVPPEFAEGKGQQQIPPEIQQKMQQAAQLVQALTQQLNAAMAELDSREKEFEHEQKLNGAEIASKERIADQQAKVAITKTLVDNETRANIAELNAKVKQISEMLDIRAAQAASRQKTTKP